MGIFNRNSKNQKISINLTHENYELLMDYAEQHNMNQHSVLNFLIDNFLGLNLDIKKSFATSTFKKIKRSKKAYAAASHFEEQELRHQIYHLENHYQKQHTQLIFQ